MIRGVVALFVFAFALCAYIVMRPTDGPGAIMNTPAVTRAQTETLIPKAGLPIVSAVPDARLNHTPENLNDIVSTVLANLGITTIIEDPLAAQSTVVLAEISRVSGTQAHAMTLGQLIVTAINDAQSDRDIYDTVNVAAQKHRFAVPASLIDTNGAIDTEVLLDIIVGKTQLAGGHVRTERFVPAALEQGPDGGQFYTVADGDSLARIAKMFYRDPALHVDLWAANLGVLPSGYRLTKGQSLFIP